jgi:hypothetical protein
MQPTAVQKPQGSIKNKALKRVTQHKPASSTSAKYNIIILPIKTASK